VSEDQDETVNEQSEAEPQGPRCGERLAEARREQQISVLEVAKELHLDEPKVRALERNDFDTLGAPVFAKGHLRKYAQLVGVDADDVFADYYRMTRSESIPPVIVGRVRVRRELSPGPWIAVIIVIIVAAASYWWFAVESETAVVPQTSPDELQQPERSGNSDSPIQETQVRAAVPPDDGAEADVPEPVASQVVLEPVEDLADGEMTLSLSFSGDCWTEISDATGRRLFFDMGRAGRSAEVTGTAPFAVLLGNIENVDVRRNGIEFPVTTNNPGSRTARLTIMKP
jgi:cytoskeleton protein RodZ